MPWRDIASFWSARQSPWIAVAFGVPRWSIGSRLALANRPSFAVLRWRS